jgi:hypothetical protein
MLRPLAVGAPRQIAETMGWSLPYTLGVLGRWKTITHRASFSVMTGRGHISSCAGADFAEEHDAFPGPSRAAPCPEWRCS